MDLMVRFLENTGLDASSLDSTIAEYMMELAREGGTEEEAWSVLEGCYPELEEAPKQRESFALLFRQLMQPAPSSDASTCTIAQGTPYTQQLAVSESGAADRDADVDFLREMMPHVSDRGLRYALQGATRGGDRAAAACYLADRCLLEGSGIKALEAEADVWEKNTEDKLRKAQEAERVLEEAKRRDKAERETFKDRIVRRYADEVIVENVKPEWDGGSRGKVKAKGNRGKGFV